MINLKPTKFDAIVELVGGGISGADDGTLMEYHDGQTPPTEAEIDAKFKSMLNDWEAKQYQRTRASAYPSIQEQLDMQYWDSVNGTTTWKDAIAKVKTNNPKPSE